MRWLRSISRRSLLTTAAGASGAFVASASSPAATRRSSQRREDNADGRFSEQQLLGPDGARLVGFKQGNAPFIRPRSVLEKLREVGASVKDASGCQGDGIADDTAPVQEIANYFAERGGEWFFPRGIFKTTAPIIINGSMPQRVRGLGKRGVYPGLYDPVAPNGLAVILPVHAGRAAIQFTGLQVGAGSIEFQGVALATLETGAVPTAAFAWDAANGFQRDFMFRDCSIHGFASAFDVYKSGGANAEVGLFKASHCNINRNRWIARTLNGTQWNGFSFRHNEAGQNGYLPGQGGIDVVAHNVIVEGNSLEGQRDPVKLSGAMRGVSVRDNYFEANVGTASIHLQGIRGPFDVGPNTFIAVDQSQLSHNVLLTNCGHGRILGPYWSDGIHKMAPPVLGSSAAGGDNILNPRVNSDDHGFLRMDSFDQGHCYTREPEHVGIVKQRVTVAGRELAPWNGQPMPVEEHIVRGSGALELDIAISGSPGNWAVVSWLFKRVPDAGKASDPYIDLSINGTGDAGSRAYVAWAFDEHWRQGEWCLLTAAIKLGVAMASLKVNLFPYGVNPDAGRATRFVRPIVYITDTPNRIVPYIDDYTARSVMAPPPVPGFQPGDMLNNASASASGQAQFVKLAGGDDEWVYA